VLQGRSFQRPQTHRRPCRVIDPVRCWNAGEAQSTTFPRCKCALERQWDCAAVAH